MLELGDAHSLSDLIEAAHSVEENLVNKFGFEGIKDKIGNLFQVLIENIIFLRRNLPIVSDFVRHL